MAGADAVSELGPYRLVGELGRGGMGVLYEAEHTRLRRRVALKLLAPRFAADEDFRERFVRESQLLAAMEHPSIIPIYDAGEVDGLLYIAMRYVEGGDLGRLLEEEGPLEPARALGILEEVGGALDAAHARDLVHRDVKPANILLDEPSGRVFLTDFGVAKRGRTGELTRAGAVVGTVDYAAPEQVQGEAVGPAADVYSLGCVLFETLSGRRVFEKDTDVAVMFAHALEEPPVLTALRPELPAAVDRVVATAMAKDPVERYASCRALVAAAREALGLVAAPALPDSTGPDRAEAAPASSPLRSNVPAPGTLLVGREREVGEVEALLASDGVRLVTLTGPGGTGKTRLAIALAIAVENRFPGGTAFVDLAPISDPPLLVSVLAETLGVDEQADGGATGERLLAAVCARLQGSRRLLVLDNFEHVLAAAPVVGELLGRVPGLTVLATSQAPLHLTLEREYTVPPLALPEPGAAVDVKAAARSPAIALFLERARAVVPGFELDDGNVAAVSAICARLDGLPLAIELAVPRLRLLSPQLILERLESTLDLLTGGARDLPARHQTLRAAIDWSYGLLEPGEQVLLQRLAVFSGGFTLKAAEAVAGFDDSAASVLDGVESLVGKSLLSRREAAGEPRLVMLQSIQEYALFRLLELGEVDDLRERHARFYLTLAERAEPELVRADQAEWVQRLELEAGNLRAALAWALERGELELGMRAAGALTRYWSVRGHMTEGRRWLEQALEREADVAPPVRAKALYAAGYAALGQGDLRAAGERFEESLALGRTNGDEQAVAMALAQLGWLIGAGGDSPRSEAISEESLALARRLGDPRTASVALANLAEAAAARGEYDRAAELLDESLGLRREAGDRRNVANALLNLGRIELARDRDECASALLTEGLELAQDLRDTWGVSVGLSSLAVIALEQGDRKRASTLLAECLTLCSERHDTRLAAECLTGLGSLALVAGDARRAGRLSGAAEGLRESIGAVPSPVERRLLRGRLGATGDDGDTVAAERAHGKGLSFEGAVADGLSGAAAAAVGTSSQ